MTLPKIRIEAKNISCTRIQSISMAKTICWTQYTKKNRSRKKMMTKTWWQALYKLINNVVYGKTMENLRNRIDVKLVSTKKEDYLKWASKLSYISHKIFDNDLVTICKNKFTLTLNKSV